MLSTKKNVLEKSIPTSSKQTADTKKKTTREGSMERNKTKKPEINTIKSKTKTISNKDTSSKTSSTVPKSIKKIKQTESVISIASPRMQVKTTNKSSIQANLKTSINKPLKVKHSNAPSTPPNTRIIKSQFYPSKEMYTNALKLSKPKATESNTVLNKLLITKEDGRKIRERNRTHSKKTEVVKTANDEHDTDQSLVSVSERPGTATLIRGKVVNPDNPDLLSLVSVSSETDDLYNYEDDFDSYESDFEEYTSSDTSKVDELSSDSTESRGNAISNCREHSTVPLVAQNVNHEDEKKLDSGNFEMQESKFKQNLCNIKETVEKENILLNTDCSRSNMASLSDEGFEDGKSLKHPSIQFINFADAQKQCHQRQNNEKRRKRGEDILSMIRFDCFSFTLFELAPIPYEKFIKIYGQSNMIQQSTQTGEDNVPEETQTENIDMIHKWTQFPIKFTKIDETNPNFLELYKKEIFGVGSVTNFNSTQLDTCYKNNYFLDNFMIKAGQLILDLMEDSSLRMKEKIKANTRLPFTDGYISLETKSVDVLEHRVVVHVSFSYTTNLKILTVHECNKNSGSDSLQNARSIICLWSLFEPKQPEKLFIAFGDVCCSCFAYNDVNLVFGGLKDGTICVWDAKETKQMHDSVLENSISNAFLFRTPTYTTEISIAHWAKVIAIVPLPETTHDDVFSGTCVSTKTSSQIYTLDEEGEILIWIINREQRDMRKLNNEHGLSHWGNVTLIQNGRISLRTLHPELHNLHCTDITVNEIDPNHIFVSTNYGYVVHCLAGGGKINPKKFISGTKSQSNCLISCPFSPLYFLVGFSNGNIGLYARFTKKPLIMMSNKEDSNKECQIDNLQWSYKPCIFYAKDSTNYIHIWNLAESDIFPIYSIPFKEEILYMKLSPTIATDKVTKKSYMIIATEKSLQLHILDNDHCQQNLDTYQQDVKKFLNYVNRL